MKKFIAFFIAFLMTANLAWASTKHHNDPMRNIDAKCMENNPGNKASEGFNYNEYAFCNFPRVRRCANAGGAHWVDDKKDGLGGCETRMCFGFSYEDYDSQRMIPVPSDRSKLPTMAERQATCWKFECNQYHINYNGKCITRAECQSISGKTVSSDGKECVSDKWCSDDWRNNYNSLIHDRFAVGSCDEFRCKKGTCFRSATDQTCVSVTSGTFAGSYCTSDGFANTCPSGQFVSQDGAGCVQGKIATMAQMRACFDCPFEAGFRECIESNGAIRTKCNDSSATVSQNADGTTSTSSSENSSSSGSGTSVTCSAGTYLSANTSVCASCPANYYCTGGTYTTGSTQGRIACPSSHPNSAAGNKSINTCYRDCPLAESALRMTGSDYYSGTDSCRILSCASNYTLSGNKCLYSKAGSGGGSGGPIYMEAAY